MFKFGTLGIYNQAINNPRVKATGDIKNGNVFKVDSYSSGGAKSANSVVVGGTPAAGTLKISVADHLANITTTSTTVALTATVIYTALGTILIPYGYTLDNTTPGTVVITAPASGASTAPVVVTVVDAGASGVTLTPTITAGSDAVAYTEATTAISSGTATDQYFVALNIIDQPELWTRSDFKISAGGFVNAYGLNNLIGYPVEISSDLVTTTYSTVAVGDVLIPDNGNFKWVKGAKGTFAVALKVIEKTTFGDTGLYCKIV
jgi:hypothetical protein